jgi:hypothetical protein
LSRRSISYWPTLSGINLPRFLNTSLTQRTYGSVKVWKLTPSSPSRNLSVRIVAQNPSTVYEKTNKRDRVRHPLPGQEGADVAET